MKHLSRQSMAAGAVDNGMHTDGVEDDDMELHSVFTRWTRMISKQRSF